jgi:nucleotide-binding universal stress UspA family protein
MSERNAKNRVMVTLDGSEQAETALPFARTLAAGNGEIIVLRVVSDREALFDTSGLLVIPAEAEFSFQLDEAKSQSEASIKKYDDVPGVTWRAETRLGDPAGMILSAARELEADFIVMASTGKGAFSRLALGSVADRIARTSPIPVLIVRAGNEPVVKRLLVPVDGSDLSRAAIPVARDLALRLNVPIQFVYVMDYTKITPGGLGTSVMTRDIQEQLISEASLVGQQVLNEAVGEVHASGVVATERLLRGIAGQSIIEATEPGDLTVMSSHGRSGITRWLIGSVAEKLVRTGPSPVLLVPAKKRVAAEHVEVTI